MSIEQMQAWNSCRQRTVCDRAACARKRRQPRQRIDDEINALGESDHVGRLLNSNLVPTHLDVVDRHQRLAACHYLWRADVLTRIQDLAVKIAELDRVRIDDHQTPDPQTGAAERD